MDPDTVLPEPEQVRTQLTHGVLAVTLARPDVRNAMSLQMVTELEAVFDAVEPRRDVRVIVLRGEGGHFCAGGDIKDMASARTRPADDAGRDALAVVNRRFGTLVTKVDRAPQAVVVVLEGAVLGGGLGLACVADFAIARADAKFGLPETSLGIPPAQIAPFLVRRLGFSTARRLAVTGGRFDARAAERLGLVHHVAEDDTEVQTALEQVLASILRCAPGAIAATKHVISQVGTTEHETLLDEAADAFARAARGPEGVEGMMAFLQKRAPTWAGGGS
jgi:isohexenylglutaconyl-CoA hydratase